MKLAALFVSLSLVLLIFPQAIFTQQQKPEDLAQKSAEAWLALIDSGKYADSWTEASSAFKGAVSRDQWVGQLTSVRTPLGKLVSRKFLAAKFMNNPPSAPAGEYVVLQYNTDFENRKASVETVSFTLDKDSKWRAAGYFIK